MTQDSMIIMVDGGFCSQLVKYALGEFLKHSRNVKVKYDVSWFDNNGMDCDGKNKRELQINKVFPNLDFEIATCDEIAIAKRNNHFINSNPYKFCSSLLAQKTPAYIDGYYENIVYMDTVRNVLLKNLDFSKCKLDENNENILSKIKNADYSCAVHVRRGDFVNLGLAFLTPWYYSGAIKTVQKKFPKTKFFFFSNDIDYVRQEIIPLCGDIEYTIVDVNNNDTGWLDLYLISQCNAQISSNSSFGFWGAFLNQNDNKMYVLPSQWLPNSKDKIGLYASVAHYLPNAVLLDENGNNSLLRKYKYAVLLFFQSLCARFKLLKHGSFRHKKINNRFGDLKNVFYEAKQKQRVLYKNKKSVRGVFLGSSHVAYGFNPDFCVDGFYNLGSNSQDLFTASKVFEYVVEHCPNLKTVVIGIDVFSRGWDLSRTSAKHICTTYKYLYKVNYRPDNTDVDMFNKCYKLNRKKFRRNFNINGYLLPPALQFTDTVEQRVEGHLREHKRKVSQYVYICDMHNIAKKYNVQMFICLMPARRDYVSMLPNSDGLYADLYELVKERCIPIINFYDSAEFNDSDFYDYDHLNTFGAEKFSKNIRRYIK